MPVRVKREIIGFKGDECDCGRRASILHCNACGSTRIYSRTGRLHTHLDGTASFVEIQYRCQTCGHLFIQEERKFCDAPPVSEALAKLKVQRLANAVQQGEYLRPEDAKAAEAIGKLIDVSKEKVLGKEEVARAEESQPQAQEVLQNEPQNIPPLEGISREESDTAIRALRLEWAMMKLSTGAPTATADEYVERRLKGEVFQ